jgi:acetate kinase
MRRRPTLFIRREEVHQGIERCARGLDTLVFTAGIGGTRRGCSAGLLWPGALGVDLDEARNGKRSGHLAEGSRVAASSRRTG